MSHQRFLGRGWSFPPAFNAYDKNVTMSEYEQDIEESLSILLSTSPGERIMQPDFGCGLKRLVFESIDESIKTKIKDLVERAILFFEPRIDVENVRVKDNNNQSNNTPVDQGVLFIQIEYRIRQTNSRSNIVYPFYFIEGTNI